MVADEKKQEKNADEFGGQFRKFEEQMKLWKVAFN